MVHLDPHEPNLWTSMPDGPSQRSTSAQNNEDGVLNGTTEIRARAAHGGQLRRHTPTTHAGSEPKVSARTPSGPPDAAGRAQQQRVVDQLTLQHVVDVASQQRGQAAALLAANEVRGAYRTSSMDAPHLASPADQVIDGLSGPRHKVVTKHAPSGRGLRKTAYVLPPEYLDDDTVVDEVNRAP